MQRLAIVLALLAASSGCETTQQVRPASTEPEDTSVMSEAEKHQVRRQVEQNWLVDAGTPGLEHMIVEIVVEMNPDGSVQSAEIDRSRYSGDSNWDKYAESCLRAVWKSSPLRMPADKPYEQWKQMRLIFHGRMMAQ